MSINVLMWLSNFIVQLCISDRFKKNSISLHDFCFKKKESIWYVLELISEKEFKKWSSKELLSKTRIFVEKLIFWKGLFYLNCILNESIFRTFFKMNSSVTNWYRLIFEISFEHITSIKELADDYWSFLEL